MKTMLLILSLAGLAALLLKAGVGLRTVAKLTLGLPLILSIIVALGMFAALVPSTIA